MGLSIEAQDLIAKLNQRAEQAEHDARILAGRLMFEDPCTMAPDTIEVMRRWGIKLLELNNG